MAVIECATGFNTPHNVYSVISSEDLTMPYTFQAACSCGWKGGRVDKWEDYSDDVAQVVMRRVMHHLIKEGVLGGVVSVGP